MKKKGSFIGATRGVKMGTGSDMPAKVKTMGRTGGTISPSGTDMVRSNTKNAPYVCRKMDYGQK